jgi:thioredoxin-like negative regulator of GroEL
MRKDFNEMQNLYPNIKYITVNIDTLPETIEKFDLKGLPTYGIFKSGNIIDKWTGGNAEILKNKCKEYSEKII